MTELNTTVLNSNELEGEWFTCWRCEQRFPEDEKYPFGLEWVCDGCDEE